MKSSSLGTKILFMVFVLFIVIPCFISYFEYSYAISVNKKINTTTTNNNNLIDNDIIEKENHRLMMINTTNISNCLPVSSTNSNESYPQIQAGAVRNNNGFDDSFETNNNNNNNSSSISNNHVDGLCNVYVVPKSSPLLCIKYLTNNSQEFCNDDDDNDTISENEKELNYSNFSNNGFLMANTKFKNQYVFETKDPLNSNKTLRVDLDFDKHTQGSLKNLNSPRIELIREDKDGKPDMSAAKNQIILWNGNIKGYFKKPVAKFENETYITLQFNTGSHTSNEAEEKMGFGALFDVSGTSNPNLLEYRDDGHYVKYNYDTIKRLAGKDFIFYHIDKIKKPVFLNKLTYKDNVKLKVITYLTKNDSRVIKTFIDDGRGKEIPYWAIQNLSKLMDYDKVGNKNHFINTVKQGSGYVIARTDNIDTRLLSFNSLVI